VIEGFDDITHRRRQKQLRALAARALAARDWADLKQVCREFELIRAETERLYAAFRRRQMLERVWRRLRVVVPAGLAVVAVAMLAREIAPRIAVQIHSQRTMRAPRSFPTQMICDDATACRR
jgi:acetolactate synthase regulatory subunit